MRDTQSSTPGAAPRGTAGGKGRADVNNVGAAHGAVPLQTRKTPPVAPARGIGG